MLHGTILRAVPLMAHILSIAMPSFAGSPPLSLTCIESSPFGENTYVLARTDRGVCVVFDPGFEPDAIIEVIENAGLEPQAILLTHGHSDHIAGNAALKKRWPDMPILVGESEANKLGDPEKNLSRGFGIDLVSPPADRTLRDHEQFELAGFRFEVHEIPGHSSGHVAFLVWPEEARDGPPMVFAGDILFRGSIGRTDFPDGSFPILASGIRERLYPLPEASLVLPGHGEPTTIGRERASNPYVSALTDGLSGFDDAAHKEKPN
jgi:hydroxyacylglutathione hydrolase